MNDIAVSIVCNTYNHEKYVRDALNGFVLQKTSFPIEVLVHDDASTDHTAEIIREYEQEYPDLIKPIYETENQYHKKDGTIKRLQSARAQGKYIAICEGDDYWTDPQKLQKQYDFMEAHPEYTMCGCSTQWLNVRSGKALRYSMARQDMDVSLNDFVNPRNSRPFPTVAFFMKAEIWRDLPSWGFPVGDLPMTFYAAMQGKVRMLADCMCVYRWFAEGSWTSRMSGFAIRNEVHEKMIRGYENMNRDTNYQYDGIIRRCMMAHKYTIAKYNHDFQALTTGELGKMYRKRTFAHRVMDRLCCQAPKIYTMLEKIAGRQ